MTSFVYSGRDNTVRGVLYADGVAIGADQFSRFILRNDSIALDSTDLGIGPGLPFDTSESVGGVVALTLRLGDVGLAVGPYPFCLVTFDPDHMSGLVWDDIHVTVLQG